jgi:hypothetical protein
VATSLAGEPQLLLPGPGLAESGVEFDIVLSRPGAARLLLYGVSGRLVRRLVDSPLGEGTHHLRWDGRTERGLRAAAGVYWLRLEAPGGTAVRRLVVLR